VETIRQRTLDVDARLEREAAARRTGEPISTATTESTVQWLLHRRMGANQQMRWSPRGAHLMLKVRTSVVNGTFNRNLATATRWTRRPFHKADLARNRNPHAPASAY
jgi:hypothetical protein